MKPQSTKPPRLAHALALLLCATAPALAAGDGRPHHLPQLPPATPATLVGSCDELAGNLAGLPNTVITGSTTVAAGTLQVGGQPVPKHCHVTGRMNDRVSPIDGRAYSIGFEMRLPIAWNGRFWYQGNGGIDGNVATATGSLGGGPRTHALSKGFAVLSSDAGHSAALGGAFGFDPQARLDYGYQAVGTLTPMAKAAIAVAYGKKPDRSYIGGCSNGGRHTLVAAARYADQYDGFLAGAPGFNLPLASLANIFGAQRYATVATDDPLTPAGLQTAFTATERSVVAAAVLQRCDHLDGVRDGLVQDTDACQRVFDLQRDVPTCVGARDGSCLTQAQKLAIAPIFRGATTSNGTPFYASFPYDSGLGSNGIPFWEFTAPLFLDSTGGVIFMVPPAPEALTNGPAFALNLDIDSALARLFATDATNTESAMQFMTPPDPTDLSDLRRRGAKVLVYQGVSDPIFSIDDTKRWYRGVDHRSGGNASDFVRLYPVPGMGHCSGGPATDQADYITPLIEWVEQGKAPERIVARARGAGDPGGVNAEVPADWAVDRGRPLCPYPSVARYRGDGSVESAESFACTPRRHGQGGGD
jgi:pimeloyl-ACP methyl ester carboxylesterase